MEIMSLVLYTHTTCRNIWIIFFFQMKDPPNGLKFQVGMKLEAIDPLNLSAICVATVMKVCTFYYYLMTVLTCSNSVKDVILPRFLAQLLRYTMWFVYRCLRIIIWWLVLMGPWQRMDLTGSVIMPPHLVYFLLDSVKSMV